MTSHRPFWLGALALAGLAACFDPQFDGTVFCGPAGECPEGDACVPQRDLALPRVCVAGGCERATANGETPCQTEAGLDGLCVAGTCAARGCGDTVLDTGEACDDGNADQLACSDVCSLPTCGDGEIQPGDVPDGVTGVPCDDGPANGDTAACLRTCVKATCGDGLRFAGVEACDDGNQNPADDCDACATREWLASPLLRRDDDPANARIQPAGLTSYQAATGQVVTLITDPARDLIWSVVDGADDSSAHVLLGDFLDIDNDLTVRDEDVDVVLRQPRAIVVDRAGRTFIADTLNRRVVRIDAAGAVDVVAGGGRDTIANVDFVDHWGGPVRATTLDLDPVALALDQVGNLYVADGQHHVVWQVDASSRATIVAGGDTLLALREPRPVPAVDTPAIDARTSQLNHPRGVAVNAAGDVYIADSGNQAIRIVRPCDDVPGAPRCIVTVAIPPECPGPADSGSAPTALALLPGAPDMPDVLAIGQTSCISRWRQEGGFTTIPTTAERVASLTFAPDGQLLVSDDLGYRVYREPFAPGGVAASPVLIGAGLAPPARNGPVEGRSALSTSADVRSMAYLGGQLHFVDGTMIWKVTEDGMLTRVAGRSTTAFAGDEPVEPRLATFAAPRGIDAPSDGAGDGGLYVADMGNNRIRRISAAENEVSTVAGSGIVPGDGGDEGPATAAQLNFPQDVAVGADGSLYIADFGNQTVRVVDPDGVIHRLAGTSGVYGNSGDGGMAQAATLAGPSRVAVDAAGTVYVVTSPLGGATIRKIAVPGGDIAAATITTFAGGGAAAVPPAGPAGMLATDVPFGVISDLVVDAAGLVVFVDVGRARVWRIDDAGRLELVAGNGSAGFAGDFGAATAAGMSPQALAIDDVASHAIALSDIDGSGVRAGLRRIDPATGVINSVLAPRDPAGVGQASGTSLATPTALTRIGEAADYIASALTGTIVSYAPVIGVQACVGRTNLVSPLGDLARYREASFGDIYGVAFAPGNEGGPGTLFFTETSKHRLYRVDDVAEGIDPNTNVLVALNRAGQPARRGWLDGPLADAEFARPHGVHVDGDRLLVADTDNHVIRAVDLTSEMVTTLIGKAGIAGFDGDGGAAPEALLFAPRAMTTCPNGNLFIADTGNQRIRRIDGDGTITTVLGNGIASSLGEGTPATDFPIWAPTGIACDATGNVYATSRDSVRLLLADDAGIVDGTGAVTTIYGAASPDATLNFDTRCLSGLVVVPDPGGDGVVHVVDRCSGALVELRHALTAPPR